MLRIDDFTDSELWTIQSTLRERYGEDREVQLADSEIRLHSADRELTTCPAAFWEDGDCHFVVIKTGDRRYRSMFYYRLYQQFGTGIDEFDDLAECLVATLQAQADHERDRKKAEEAE